MKCEICGDKIRKDNTIDIKNICMKCFENMSEIDKNQFKIMANINKGIVNDKTIINNYRKSRRISNKNNYYFLLILPIIVLIAFVILTISLSSTNKNPITEALKKSTDSKFSEIKIALNNGKEKLSNGVTVDKELENLWNSKKEDDEIRSLYFYRNALYVSSQNMDMVNIDGYSNIDLEKYYIMRISPDYNGFYKDNIIDFGIKLFGTKDEWIKEYEIGKQILSRQEKTYNGSYSSVMYVWTNIDTMYEDYYNKNGKEVDYKYAKTIFETISKSTGMTIMELNDLYTNKDLLEIINSNRAKVSGNNSSYSTTITDDEKGNAIAIAKEEVRSKLKSPSSAKFPWSFDSYNITKSGDTYTVYSYVEAENSYGTKIKQNYTIKFKMTGEETYIVISIDI